METISTNRAPQAIGPYVQGKISQGMLYASGQIPLDAKSGELIGTDIREQTAQVLKNIKGILTEANATFSDIVKTTCYLKNMEDFSAFNEIYASVFKNEYPARTTVEISKLPLDALVEIEMIVALKN